MSGEFKGGRTERQSKAVALLISKGWWLKSDFWCGEEYTAVMYSKDGKYAVEVEEDGTIDGIPFEDFDKPQDSPEIFGGCPDMDHNGEGRAVDGE